MIVKEIYQHIKSVSGVVELLEDDTIKVDAKSLIEIAKEMSSAISSA